jgi:hypothetical protein
MESWATIGQEEQYDLGAVTPPTYAEYLASLTSNSRSLLHSTIERPFAPLSFGKRSLQVRNKILPLDLGVAIKKGGKVIRLSFITRKLRPNLCESP